MNRKAEEDAQSLLGCFAIILVSIACWRIIAGEWTTGSLLLIAAGVWGT